MFLIYGMSAGKRDQIEIFFKKKFLSKIDVDLIIWFRIFIISKKNYLSIWSLFSALTPNVYRLLGPAYSFNIYYKFKKFFLFIAQGLFYHFLKTFLNFLRKYFLSFLYFGQP